MIGVGNWAASLRIRDFRLLWASTPLSPLAWAPAPPAFAAIATTVTVYGWRVLSKSIHSASRANTPLETPLWIPQVFWWSGWIWFSITSCLIAILAAGLFVARRSDELRNLAGTEEET